MSGTIPEVCMRGVFAGRGITAANRHSLETMVVHRIAVKHLPDRRHQYPCRLGDAAKNGTVRERVAALG